MSSVLGFFVRPPFIALDLDGCVNLETGDVEEWATQIIRETRSYIEISPSGKGIRIFGFGTKPGNKSKIGSVEIYTEKRGLTVTGYPIPTSGELCAIDVTNTYNKMVNREYMFGEPAYERIANERASSAFGRQIHEGTAITNLLTLLSTGDYTPNAKPFRVTDKYDNWVEYPSQSEAVGGYLVCLALKHDSDRGNTEEDYLDSLKEKMEQDYLDSNLSNIPKWANGKWARVGKDEIKSAIAFVRKPLQPAAATTTPADQPAVRVAPANAQEDVKATSLLIFKTVEEVKLAADLGFNALVASDFKPPLGPAFNRAVIFSDGKDEVSQHIYHSIPGTGAIYSGMPRKAAWNLANLTMDEAATVLNKLMNLDGGITLRCVNAKRMKYEQVPVDSDTVVQPGALLKESGIPSFDTSVMEGNIFGEFVHLATDGTTLRPQFSYQLARLILAAVLTGRVQYDLIADATPLRRLVLIGETGSGKGASFARAEKIITINGTGHNRYMRITDSIDSGAGLKDMFWDEPVGLPILVYIDEVLSLGHKSSDKKNPDILDTIGELADRTRVSRVLAKRGTKGTASKTLNNAYLTTVMCAQDGMAFMCATAGRKAAGFNDRQIPVFNVPVEAGDLPVIPMQGIVEWWTKVDQILANVGTKEDPGLVVMSPEACEMVEAFWNTQPAAIRTKVRFKKYLQQDAYLNAVVHGRMLVSTDDVTDAIKDCKLELATRHACFQEEASDRVGYYYAVIKRLTYEMAEKLRKAGANVDPFEIAMSESDFENETRSQANNEPEPFARAWRHWMPKHLEALPKRAARNGREVIRYVPARSERD